MNRKFNRFLGMIVTSALAVMSLGGCKDASSDLVPTPELKGLTPNVLTWAADETEPKTIEIEGTDLKDAKFILSGTTDFYTEVDGTTITVTPKDVNDLDEDVINILTVSIKGGKSLTATLTQTKPIRVPNLTALTPDALTWGPEETTPKTIEVAGDYLTGRVLTATLPETSNFTATVEGDVVTVAPKAANTTETVFEETLTVAVEGGNSLTATLTQAKPAPALTALTPEALTWAADETAAKTIEVAASYLAGAALTVTLPESSNFTATVEGTVVTVAPKAANTGATAFVETLTVSVEGGNSLEATLTQTPPAPALTALTPNALTWAAENADAKTIAIEGSNIAGKTITLSELTNFTATVSGTTVTVTPKAANTGNADVVETLTVAVEGGNSLEATLTQTKPVPVITGLDPETLTWASAEIASKTISVAGSYLDGKTLTVSELANFNVSVDGTTVTVTPKVANESDADFVETLTVSVEGGNSLTATLTQTKPALVPTLTSLTPNALTWAAAETGAQTITVAGEHLETVTLTVSELTNFTATVSGTTITVTPKSANATYEAVEETLTVSFEGGNSLTATLTQQAKPRPALTSLTPNALTWEAAETGAKTITVAGTNLEAATITATVEGSVFTAIVEGTTVTVTPTAVNETDAAVTATLTVAVQDGNSLTATLTQEAKPRPALTSLTPDALTWAAAETEAKTIAVAGTNLEGAAITATVEGDAFTATVEGATVTVTPAAANEGDADVTATLTVSVEGGNSLTATLTQTKPESTGGEVATSGWIKVTENKEDWSGTYLFVAEVEPANRRAWDYDVMANGNLIFLTFSDSDAIVSGNTVRPIKADGTANPDYDATQHTVSLEGLNAYAITIIKTDAGYAFKTPENTYLTNTTGQAGTDIVNAEDIAATSITMDTTNATLEIYLEKDGITKTRFGFFNANRRFNYFPHNKWDSTRSNISLYEYRQ